MAFISLFSRKQYVGYKKKMMYITKAVRYSTIGKDELIEHASQDSSVPSAMLGASYDALFVQIKELLLNGHSIQLGDLGTLRFSINAQAVTDKEDVGADLVKSRKILFRPSPKLRRLISAVNFKMESINDGESTQP